jgi:hypothetical protein
MDIYVQHCVVWSFIVLMTLLVLNVGCRLLYIHSSPFTLHASLTNSFQIVLAAVFTVYDGIAEALAEAETSGAVMPIGELLVAAFFPFLKNKETPGTEEDLIILTATEDPISLKALDTALAATKQAQGNNISIDTEERRECNTVVEDVAEAFRGLGCSGVVPNRNTDEGERYTQVIQNLRSRGRAGSPVSRIAEEETQVVAGEWEYILACIDLLARLSNARGAVPGAHYPPPPGVVGCGGRRQPRGTSIEVQHMCL